MQQLTGIDATFLYLETPNVPMHIGALSVMEGSLAFEDFRDLLLSRIHLVPNLRQRLAEIPLGLDRPYWVDDPDFNIDRHLAHIALPAPGGWRQLRNITSRLFSQTLDRSRPLWEMVFVEGLNNIPQVPPHSVAIISKIHHAAIDGKSGADILGLLFDITPKPRKVAPEPPRSIPPVPSNMSLIARSAVQMAKRPRILPRLVVETAKAAAVARSLKRVEHTEPPVLPYSAPRSPINGPVSSNRVWNTALLSLDRVKKIKNTVEGTTINDVMLAICAGALRQYLLNKDALPSEPLVAMVPISTRTKAESNTGGNQIAAMFIQLATNIKDPIERLRKIHQNAKGGKTVHKAVNAKALVEYSEFVPFGLAGQAARLYSRSHLADRHRPVFNVVITNVPGPQVPLYMAGKRLLAHMGTAPIFDGMGLMMPIFSYNGVISISPTSSDNIMPDIDTFARLLRESANELEAAAFAIAPKDDAETEPAVPKAAVAKVFGALSKQLKKAPEMPLPGEDIYGFAVTGDQAQAWTFDLKNTPRRIYKGTADDAACTMTMADNHFLAMVSGDLDGTSAFMQGKLKVEGDINKAIAFGKVLAAFPKAR